MSAAIVITIIVVVIIVTAVIVYFSLRRLKKAVMDEVNRLSLRLTDMELKVISNSTPNLSPAPSPNGEKDLKNDESGKGKANSLSSEPPDLSTMTDEELFSYLSKTIKEEEMFRWSNLNRNMVMEHFSLSAVRIGNAFARGGGLSLPEFVRNCRLDYACRLMLEQPEMPFTEVGNQSGYLRTTTFYHDFKARFGMPPAEYREKEFRKRMT